MGRPPERVGVAGRVLGTRRGWRTPLIIVSTLTAIWLFAQIFVSLTDRAGTWPVTSFTMFAGEQQSVAVPTIEVRTQEGDIAEFQYEDFGFPLRGQLEGYLRRHVYEFHDGGVPDLRAGGQANLADLIAAWNRTHPSDPAVSARLIVTVYELPDGESSGTYDVTTWSTS